MLYLYAIGADVGEVKDLRGVQGETLTVIPFGGALVVVGDVGARPSLDVSTLKAQDALVRHLHDRAAALLPMRFGMTARDADALRNALEPLDDLPKKLVAVRGSEQMTVRVLALSAPIAPRAPAAPGPSAPSGTAYLKGRAEMRQASPELAAIAHAAESLSRNVRIDPANQQGLHGSVYHLIERGRSDEYRAAINRAAGGLPNVRVLISGPSPAYAFA